MRRAALILSLLALALASGLTNPLQAPVQAGEPWTMDLQNASAALTNPFESYAAKPWVMRGQSDDSEMLSESEINEWYAPPEIHTYLQADVLWLSRWNINDRVMATSLPPLSQPVLNFRSADVGNEYRPGAIFTWGRRFDQVAAFELTYFGFHEWDGKASASGSGNLSIPGTLGLTTQDFVFADLISLDYSSRLHNFEATYRQDVEGMTLLGGFRYVNLDERLTLTSTRLATGTSDYFVHTQNQLIGGQLGIGFYEDFDDRLRLELTGKFGVFGNVAENRTRLSDLNNTFIRRDFDVRSNPVSVLGEVGTKLTFQVTDWLSVHAGYRFLWINNVALASDQFDFSTLPGAGNSIDARSYLLMHGGNAGIEVRW
jgi:hypothetical protein